MGIPNKPGNWEWYDNRQLRHIVDIVMDELTCSSAEKRIQRGVSELTEEKNKRNLFDIF